MISKGKEVKAERFRVEGSGSKRNDDEDDADEEDG